MDISGLVGSVAVEVRADLKPLDKGFDEAKQKSQAFDRQVSGTFTGMTREAALAGRAVEGSAMRAAAANENLGRSVTAVGSAYRGLIAVAGAAGLAIGSAFAFAQFIRNTVDAEKAQTQLAAALRSTGGVAGQTVAGLNAHAAALQKLTAYEDDAVTASQALLLTFTKIRGDTFNQATDAILNMATAMKQDLQGATIMVGKALNDPILGVTALTRAGVQFSASQKEVIKSLVQTGDVAGAQTMILKELERQFGGSAQAARETLGGALQALGNAWGDLFELGKGASDPLRISIESLIVAISDPAFHAFVQTMGAALFNALTAAVNVTTILADNIGTLGTAVGMLVAYKLGAWALLAAEGILALKASMGVAATASALFSASLGGIGTILAAINWPVAAIVAVGAAFLYLHDRSKALAASQEALVTAQNMVNEAMGQSIDPTEKATDATLAKAKADLSAAGAMLQRAEAELAYRRNLNESVPSLPGAPDPLAGATARLAEARKNFDSLGRTLQALSVQSAAEMKAAGNAGGAAITSATSLFNLAKDGFGDVASGLPKLGQAAGGIADGVREASGVVMSATDAMARANQANLETLLGYNAELRNTRTELLAWGNAIKSATSEGSIADFFGDVSEIENAQQILEGASNTVDRLFASFRQGGMAVRDVGDNLDMVRASLMQQGFGEEAVNKFIDALIQAQVQTDRLGAHARDLNATIQAIKDKTVTITVVTRQVGTGTQSLYSVPNSSGGSSTVGVTRYGGVEGEQSGPSISASSVPRTGGYGSMGGSGNLGSTTVNVTRFATGGMIHPGDSQRVQFFKSPEETVGIFTPSQMDAMQGGPLANPQSAYTGREATRETDRLWTVLMNIEANTRKTYEGVEKWVSSGGSGGGSGSSYGGGSSSSGSSSEDDQLSARYRRVLASVKSNFNAAGIVGSGIIGYGAGGLGASPEQIARNIVYGGMSPLGSPGATSYERSSAAKTNYALQSAFRGQNVGFSTGGIMGPGNGDTQKVEFFKSPDERVIIARPDQFEDRRNAGSSKSSSAGERPIEVKQYITVPGGGSVSKESQAELRRQAALAIQDALRSINGR